jgi:hypothetical protein
MPNTSIYFSQQAGVTTQSSTHRVGGWRQLLRLLWLILAVRPVLLLLGIIAVCVTAIMAVLLLLWMVS